LKERSKELLDGCRGPCRQRTPSGKSFLVLFFKKEHSSYPSTILAAQAINPPEFTQITRNNDQPQTAGMTGDEGVVWSDRRALFLQFNGDVGGMGGRLAVEIENGQRGHQQLDLGTVLSRAG
jgi:hypothetical protein